MKGSTDTDIRLTKCADVLRGLCDNDRKKAVRYGLMLYSADECTQALKMLARLGALDEPDGHDEHGRCVDA